MKKKIYGVVLSLIVSTSFYTGDAIAKKKLKVYRICKLKVGATLTVYQNPTIHSAVVTRLSRHSRWIVKGKGKKTYSHSRWQKISWNKKKGWVKNSCLKLDVKATNIASRNPGCLNSKTRTKECESAAKT